MNKRAGKNEEIACLLLKISKEAMLLTKQQILVQSSQAMLSQANQISSSSYEGIKQMIG